MHDTARPPRRRTRAVLGRGAETLALGALFVATATGGFVLHADVPAARRAVAAIANRALASLFQGRLEVEGISELSIRRQTHLRVQNVQVFDPEGKRVIRATGVAVELDLFRLLRSTGKGKTPHVVIPTASIDDAEVVLDVDALSQLGIARAFAPQKTSTAPAAAPDAAPTEDFRLTIPAARVRHAWVHGNLVPPVLDADTTAIKAAIRIAENELTVEGVETDVVLRAPAAPSQTGPITARATGNLSVPLDTAIVKMKWDLTGEAAGVPLTAKLGMDGDRIEAELHVPTVAPEKVRHALPLVPVTRPVELHAHASGRLPTLAVTARGKIGDGEISAEGEIDGVADLPFRFDADVVRADASSFGAPSMSIDARVHVEGKIGGGGPKGTFRLASKESTVGVTRIPPVLAEGTFDPAVVEATARAREPGVSVDAKLTLDVPGKRLAFDARGRSDELRALARAPGVMSGSASARATGVVDLQAATVQGRVTADGQNVALGPASAQQLHVNATMSGPLEAPIFAVDAQGSVVALRGPDADATPLTYPTVHATTRLVIAPSPRLEGVHLTLEPREPGPPLVATAREVRLDGGGVDVRGGRVSGLGAPIEMEVRSHVGGLSIRAAGEDLDLARASAMTGIRQLRLLPAGSRASVDMDLVTGAQGTDGHVDLAVKADDGSRAELHAKLAGKHVSATARAVMPGLGWVDVGHAELDLPGPVSERSLTRATGSVDLNAEVDLGALGVLLPEGPPVALSGIAALSARIERGDAARLPAVRATATTRRLTVQVEQEGRPPIEVSGVDASIHVAHDGATDAFEAGFVTWDQRGILASGDAKTVAPVFAWLLGERALDRAAIGALAVDAVVDFHQRGIANLPAIVARPDLRGTVALHAETSGPLSRPSVDAFVRADDLRPRTRTAGVARFSPVDGELRVRWDGQRVVASLQLDEDELSKRGRTGRPRDDEREREVEERNRTTPRKPGHVRGLILGRLDAQDLVAGRGPVWNASAELDVTDLELAPLPLPMNTEGTVNGRVKLRDLNGRPSIVATAHVDGLSVSRARVDAADVDLRAGGGAMAASAKVTQADGGSGTVHATSTALDWKGLEVQWDGSKATRVDYVVDRMSLAILQPLVRRSIPELDGRVDGRGSVALDDREQTFEGGINLTGGRVYVNALGEELTHVKATARFERSGGFRVTEVAGKAGAGEFTASAEGRMKGFRFESAQAVVVVPSKDGLPLSAEGATFAEATGELRLAATMSPDRKMLLVTAEVPRSHVEIPGRSTQTLQSLDADTTIAIGVRDANGTLIDAPLLPPQRGNASATSDPPTTSRFTVVLGDDVMLEGRGLRIYLTGRTVVELAQEVSVKGQISLKQGGTIDVQGRKFVVEHGTVTFDGDDPADPTVVAAAYWDAADRTRVWVEFSGPLKTGKLTLRSEPAYSNNEILSILLFGRPDPNTTSGGGSKATGGSQAGAVGAGFASAGLNQALGELSDDVDLEQDTTSANRLRTKVGYRLRRNLKVQLGYASGFSQREPDTTYLFLEWQFLPKWSILGTRGDRGTSILDVLFQHRY